jgi:outer membrane protein TolC
MRCSFRAAAAIVLAIAGLASTAVSQQSRILTLEAALELAREHNPDYRRALAQAGAADAAERHALGAMLPQLSVGLSTSMNQSRRFSGEDNFGQPIKRDDPLIFTGSSSNQSISLGQLTLFDGGQRFRQLRAARANGRAADADAVAVRARAEAQVSTAYFQAVRARDLIALEERLLASSRELLEATHRLLRVGSADPLDLLGAEVDVARRELSLDQARGDARKALLELGEQIGVRIDLGAELVDDLPESGESGTLDVEQLVATALARSPVIARSLAREEAARHQLSAARAARLPSVSLSASAGRSIGGNDYDAFMDLRPLDQSYGFGLFLNLPLFNGFTTSNNIAQARAQRIGASEELRAAQLQLEREIRGAAIDFEHAQRALALARRSAQLSRDRAELAQERYTLGGIGFKDLQDIVDRAAEAEREALAARLDLARARITLEEKAGGF